MTTATATPTLGDLKRLIDKVHRYPISVSELLEVASRRKMPEAVINFYRLFGKAQTFQSKDDLLNRSEQVEILRREEQPPEYWTASEED